MGRDGGGRKWESVEGRGERGGGRGGEGGGGGGGGEGGGGEGGREGGREGGSIGGREGEREGMEVHVKDTSSVQTGWSSHSETTYTTIRNPLPPSGQVRGILVQEG